MNENKPRVFLITNDPPEIGHYFAEMLTTGKYGIFFMNNPNDPQRDDCKKVVEVTVSDTQEQQN